MFYSTNKKRPPLTAISRRSGFIGIHPEPTKVMSKQIVAWNHQAEPDHSRGSSPSFNPSLASDGSGASGAPQVVTAEALPHQVSSKYKVLSKGIDTFDVRVWCCSVPSSFYLQQSKFWNQLKQDWDPNEIYYQVQFPDGTWWNLLKEGRKPYAYQLYNPEVGFIKLWDADKWSSGFKNKQQIQIKLFSKYIHQFSRSSLKNEWRRIASFFYEDTYGIDAAMCRGDLYCDIQVDRNFTYQEYMNVITRSKRRWMEFEYQEVMFDDEEEEMLDVLSSSTPSYNRGSGKLIDMMFNQDFWRKVNKMYKQQETMGANRMYGNSNEVETAYYGVSKQSKIWGKIYNKTKEVEYRKNDDIKSIWKQNGWDGSSSVLRVEFSCKSGFLNELVKTDYYRVDDYLDNVNDLWDYYTQSWMRMVEEVKHNNSTTSLITSFWNVVQSAFKSAANSIVRKRSYKGKVEQLESQGIGCIKKALSMSMLYDNDINSIKMKISDYVNDMMDSYSNGILLHKRRELGIAKP